MDRSHHLSFSRRAAFGENSPSDWCPRFLCRSSLSCQVPVKPNERGTFDAATCLDLCGCWCSAGTSLRAIRRSLQMKHQKAACKTTALQAVFKPPGSSCDVVAEQVTFTTLGAFYNPIVLAKLTLFWARSSDIQICRYMIIYI